jgi:hypothetical protein
VALRPHLAAGLPFPGRSTLYSHDGKYDQMPSGISPLPAGYLPIGPMTLRGFVYTENSP